MEEGTKVVKYVTKEQAEVLIMEIKKLRNDVNYLLAKHIESNYRLPEREGDGK